MIERLYLASATKTLDPLTKESRHTIAIERHRGALWAAEPSCTSACCGEPSWSLIKVAAPDHAEFAADPNLRLLPPFADDATSTLR